MIWCRSPAPHHLPPPRTPNSMELWGEQVCDFLDEFVQQPAVLVGNSIGSLTSLVAASAKPERVAGLALLNCAGVRTRASGAGCLPPQSLLPALAQLLPPDTTSSCFPPHHTPVKGGMNNKVRAWLGA